MPVLEYECLNCKSVYEILHLTREKPEDIICPGCGSSGHKKLISAPSINTRIKSGAPSDPPSCRYANTEMCRGDCGLNNKF